MKKFDLHIEKYGVNLGVKDGQFYVRHKKSKQGIPANKVRSIVLTRTTSITGTAIKLALDNEIDVSFIERDGMPYAKVWNSKFGSIAKIRRNQLSFAESKEASDWIKGIIEQKIKNQMALVAKIAEDVMNSGPQIKSARKKFASYLLKINSNETKDALELANQLRGWEANSSRVFFRSISACLPEEFRFDKRSKRPARDPFNATLNYCYGILYNKIEGFMIRAGLDPHIGIFHKDQYNRPVLVFDFIELFRHWAEYPVVQAFQQRILRKEHFDVMEKSVRIENPGRKIIIELFFSYMNEKIRYDNERMKRIVHIKRKVQSFASRMKEYQPNEAGTSKI